MKRFQWIDSNASGNHKVNWCGMPVYVLAYTCSQIIIPLIVLISLSHFLSLFKAQNSQDFLWPSV